MIIYLDIYIFKNIFFNFLLLYLTSYLIRKKTKWYRVLLASLLGCGYAVLALYSENIFQSSILKIIIGAGMLTITFGKKQVMNLVSSFFILAYFVAGLIASLLNVHEQLILIIFAVSAVIVFWIYQREKEKNQYYDIQIYFLEKEIELKAKLDTGNELKDSLFGDAVIVANEEKMKKELSEEIILIMNNERLKIPEQYQKRIKLISFQTISEEGIKIGIKLDKVIINLPEKQLENRAILILSDKVIKKCDVLIGFNLLEGCFEYETF